MTEPIRPIGARDPLSAAVTAIQRRRPRDEHERREEAEERKQQQPRRQPRRPDDPERLIDVEA